MSRGWAGRWALTSLLALALRAPGARAMPGFFVGRTGEPLASDVTHVALMRSGTRTVLSLRPAYRGPPEEFALVVPVPATFRKDHVRTLPVTLFDRLDRLTAPRLDEYREQDPCPADGVALPSVAEEPDPDSGGSREGSVALPAPHVRREADFQVDEYDAILLGADDSAGLEAWLRQNRYRLPDGTGPYLRPYLDGGSRFLVVRVNVGRVRFLWGRALLSPLRLVVDSERFELPVRPGLINAEGPQDLVIHVVAPRGQRYEVAGRDSLLLPTDLVVGDEVRGQLASFHASLLDRLVAGRPRAVVTEYVGPASSCDPCPAPPLSPDDLARLGAELLPDLDRHDMTLTRLRLRHGRDGAGDDLVLRPAPPLAPVTPLAPPPATAPSPPPAPGDGRDPHAAFQVRYLVPRAWSGPLACAAPDRGRWEGPFPAPPSPPAALVPVRRDLPVDRLLASSAPLALPASSSAPLALPASSGGRLLAPPASSGGALPGAALAPPGRRPAPGLADRLWSLLPSLRPALPALLLATLALGLAAVLVAARRWRAGALAHGALFVALAASPLLAHAVPSLGQQVRETPLVALFFTLGAASVAALTCLRAALVAGRRPPAWALALASLGPALAGVLSYGWGVQVTRAAVAGAHGLPVTQARILVQGEGESTGGLAIGATASVGLLLLSAWWLAGRAPVAPGRRSGPTAAVSALALLLGLALLRFARGRLDAHDAPTALALVLSGALALRLSRRRSGPAALDPTARSATALASGPGDVLCLVLLAALLLAALPVLGARHAMLDAAAQDRVTHADARALLAAGLRQARALALQGPALALAALGPAVFAVFAGRPVSAASGPKTSARPASGAAVARALGPWWATGALVVLGAALVAAARGSLPADVARERQRLDAVADLLPPTPPAGDEREREPPSLAGPLLVVDAAGALLASPATDAPPRPLTEALWTAMGQPSTDAGASPVPLLLVDRRLTYAALRASLAPLLDSHQSTFRWLTGATPESAADLGRYTFLPRALQRPGVFEVDLIDALSLDAPPSWQAPRPERLVLAARVDGDQLTTRSLLGGLGRYVGNGHAESLSRDRYESSLRQRVYSWFLGDRERTDEIIVAIDPRTTAEELSARLTLLARYPYRSPLDRENQRAVPFVLTTDPALFGDARPRR